MKVYRLYSALRGGLVSGLVLTLVILAAAQVLMAQRRASANVPPPPQHPGMSGDEQIIINTDLITLTVSVIDADGRAVSGLDKSAFTVLDDNVPQEVSFFSDEDAPASVGIIFDVSGSMSGDKIVRAGEALASFNRDESRERRVLLD